MKRRPLIPYFVLCFAITWGLGGLYLAFPSLLTRVFGQMSIQSPVFILAVWGPTLSACIVTALTEGKPGLARLLRRLLPGRARLYWYLFSILAFPACGMLINWTTRTPIGLFSTSIGPLLSFLLANLITGPLGEEFGWRGFALPRLLQTYSPLVASLILGLIWGTWHLPSFFFSELPQGSISLPLFLLGALSLSVTITWMYLHVKGSILFSILLHYTINFSLSMIGVPFLYLTLLQTAVALLLCLIPGSGLTTSPRERKEAPLQ